jgi:hypothetical protein
MPVPLFFSSNLTLTIEPRYNPSHGLKRLKAKGPAPCESALAGIWRAQGDGNSSTFASRTQFAERTQNAAMINLEKYSLAREN